MGEENQNWFTRHRNAVLGIAIAVILLNIALYVFVPEQTEVLIDQTVTEYAADDESFAKEHTLQLSGMLTRSMLAKSTFEGTIWMSDVEGMDAPMGVHLTRADGRWSGYFTDEAGQPHSANTELAEINAGKSFENIVITFWDTRTERTDGGVSAEFDLDTAHFAAVDAGNRRAALTQFHSYYVS